MAVKIAIIDDEALVRLGMKSIIEWQEHGYAIVCEAGNGIQGLEVIAAYNPDIVLVDIMMPQMDGLKMIAEAKKKGFRGKFIILSCVSEFEYLQKAIRMGVSRYILKSAVNPQEILDTVSQVSDELNKNRVFGEDFGMEFDSLNDNFAMNEFLNLVFKGVIYNHQEINEKMRVFGFPPEKNICLQIYLARQEESQKDFMYKIAAIGKSLLEEDGGGSCFVNFEDYLVLLFPYEQPQICGDISFRLCMSVKQYFNTKMVFAEQTIGKNDYSLHETYMQARQELRRDYFGETEQMREWSGIIPPTEFSSYDKLKLAFEIIRGMMVQSNTISEKKAKEIYAGAVEHLMMLYELDIEEVCPPSFHKIDAFLKSFDSFEQMYHTLLEMAKSCYQLASQKGYTQYNDDLTDKIIKYIHRCYDSKITAKDVADHVHFSTDYVCKYFKKKTNTGLTDYILKLKIHKSKEDLLRGKTVSQAAEDYSFSSVSHYLKTFKRYEGVTPGTFVRENIINRNN